MRQSRRLVLLADTRITPPRGARVERLSSSSERLTLTIRLRSRAAERNALLQTFDDVVSGRLPPLSRAAFAERFGADQSDIAIVRRFARAHQLRVGVVSVPQRMLHLSGRASALTSLFGVRRVRYTFAGERWNSYTGPIQLPIELAECVTGVFGFDERPQATRRSGARPETVADLKARLSYSPLEVAALYSFPPGLDGRGQSVGLIALGGGYLNSDLRTFFRHLRLPHPRITSVSVSGAKNAPHGLSAAFDGEVTGDIETLGSLVPRANIAVYFAPNSARGFLEAVATAVHDARHNISVLSISWGQAEVHWSRHTIRELNDVLLEAAVLGMTVCCASGDHGSFADALDREPHVCFPASSPYVLACGGTTLVGRRSRIASESVWHNTNGASGGGVSAVFPLPAWQQRSRVPRAANGQRGRGVPDVASNADPSTGYRIFGHGHWHVGAGTSAAAPLWAGLIARINQMRQRPVGLITPFLYSRFDSLVRTGAMRVITKGSNGKYRARRGWSCCTGNGAPHGTKLAKAYLAADKGRRRASRGSGEK